MAPGADHLPDFSKGERIETAQPVEFTPLFGQVDNSQTWPDEPGEPANDPGDMVDDLAALVSELNDLPTGLDEPEAVEVEEAVPAIGHEEHEAAIAELQQQHAAELERLQAEHNEDVLKHLQALQSGLVDDVSDRIEQTLAEALRPLFEKQVVEHSLDQMIAEIKRDIQYRSLDRVLLRGPDALVNAVSNALADGALKIEAEPAETTDLVVHLDDKILSTCIGDWSRKIEEALGE